VERILLIYDDPRSEQTVRRILEPAGYDVITVPLDPIALGVIHKTKPGLVVLDVCRPGKSSQDLCRRIRVNSERVPLLVLSDGGSVADVVLLLTLGADGYITKPFSPDEFMARVRVAMRHLIS
jgi:DNA-binding response OmpR family regulator